MPSPARSTAHCDSQTTWAESGSNVNGPTISAAGAHGSFPPPQGAGQPGGHLQPSWAGQPFPSPDARSVEPLAPDCAQQLVAGPRLTFDAQQSRTGRDESGFVVRQTLRASTDSHACLGDTHGSAGTAHISVASSAHHDETNWSGRRAIFTSG